jgi:hypothetical protein
MEEFHEMTTTIFRGEELMGGIVVNGIEDDAPRFPEGIAVEEDVSHGPGGTTVRANGVVPSRGSKRCGIVCMESMMGGELKSCALECA